MCENDKDRMLLSQPQNENNRKNFAFLFAKKKDGGFRHFQTGMPNSLISCSVLSHNFDSNYGLIESN